MAFSILPPELLLQIAKVLDHRSTLELAVTCEGLHKLFRETLAEHARLSIKYKVIHAGRSHDDDHLLWSTLKEILEDPCRGWYVREINLSSRSYHWDVENRRDRVNGGFRPDNMLAVTPEEDQAIIIKAAHEHGDLYPAYLGLRDGSRSNPDPEDLWTTFVGSLETRISSGWMMLSLRFYSTMYRCSRRLESRNTIQTLWRQCCTV
jgi:hypothetical protein